MKKIVYYICMVMIILFAMESIALAMTPEEVCKELMTVAVKTEVEVKNTADGTTMMVPVIAISDSAIADIGYEGKIEIANGEIHITTPEGETYSQTFLLGTDGSSTIAPDQYYEGVALNRGYNVNETRIGEDVAEAYYEQRSSEDPNDGEIHYFTYALLKADEINTGATDVVSFSNVGSTSELYAVDTNQLDRYDDFVQPGPVPEYSTKVSLAIPNENDGVIVYEGDEPPIDSIVTEVELTEPGQSSEVELNEDKKEFRFNISKEGDYLITLYDKYGNIIAVDVYEVSTGNQVAVKSQENGAVAAFLRRGEQYVVEAPDDGCRLEVTFAQYSNEEVSTTETLHDIAEIKNNDKALFKEIEKLMSGFVLSIAKVLNWMLADALGETITLDSIVFNEYEPVKINFWKTGLNGETVTANNTINLLRDSINRWFGIFRNIAIIGYMIILVYVGIKMLLSSTTPNKMAVLKNAFIYWVMGVLILFFFPYVMKYSIIINDAFVKQISDEFRIVKSTASLKSEKDAGYLFTDFDDVIDFESGQDYMSIIGNMANKSKKLGIAIAYLVLTWQLIMMLIYYYKRMFIVAFLVVIFPLIALTFVWDKLNDGRSQALSAWTKEFLISVFVQSFHAIVFAFVTHAIYSTLTQGSADFILLVIASSFMFAGENILKQIFGGGDTIALGSVTQTATKIAATTTLVTGVGKRIITNVAGKNGFVRGNISSYVNHRKYKLLLKKDENGVSNFQKVATPPAAATIRVNRLLPSEGEVTPNIQQAAEMVDAFNNPHKKSPEELAKALESYDRLMKLRNGIGSNAMSDLEKKQFDEIMKNTNVSPAQIDRLNKALLAASVAYGKKGSDAKQIRQNLRIEVEYAFKARDTKDENGKIVNEQNKATANAFLHAALINAKKNGVRGIRRTDVEMAYRDKIEESRDFYENIRLTNSRSENRTARNKVRQERANGLADKYVKSFGAAGILARKTNTSNVKVNNIEDLTQKEKAALNSCARNVAILEQLGSNDVDTVEAVNAMKSFENNRELAEKMLKLSNVRADIDQLRYLLAKKIVSENPGINRENPNKVGARDDYNEAVKWANSVVDSMEAQARNLENKRNLSNPSEIEDNGDYDPYVDILDIIAGAQKGSSTGSISNLEEMFSNASKNNVVNDFVDSRMDSIRSQNQKNSENAKMFAEETLKKENLEISNFRKAFREAVNGPKDNYEQPTFNGYTEADIRRLDRAEKANMAASSARLISDIAIVPTATVAGAAIGMASTNDGIPLEEGVMGALSGFEGSQLMTDSIVSTLTQQKRRTEKQNDIAKKIKKRLRDDAKERLRAHNEFEEARDNARGQADSYLEIKIATANLYLTANDELSATVHVIAENAQFIHVDEEPTIGSWEPYQENINYIFRDNDKSKSHNLYIYVRDDSGNIKTTSIMNLEY